MCDHVFTSTFAIQLDWTGDWTVFVPYSTAGGRFELLKINLRGVSMSEDVLLEEIAEKMSGYSGADITNVCR